MVFFMDITNAVPKDTEKMKKIVHLLSELGGTVQQTFDSQTVTHYITNMKMKNNSMGCVAEQHKQTLITSESPFKMLSSPVRRKRVQKLLQQALSTEIDPLQQLLHPQPRKQQQHQLLQHQLHIQCMNMDIDNNRESSPISSPAPSPPLPSIIPPSIIEEDKYATCVKLNKNVWHVNTLITYLNELIIKMKKLHSTNNSDNHNNMKHNLNVPTTNTQKNCIETNSVQRNPFRSMEVLPPSELISGETVSRAAAAIATSIALIAVLAESNQLL